MSRLLPLLLLLPLAGWAQQSDLKQAGVCSRCHVVSVLEWQISAHVAAGTACIQCHGPSEAHVANERNEVSPDRIPRGPAAAGLCMTCHTAGCPTTQKTADCVSCHSPHTLTSPEQIQTFQGDRAAHPIHAEVERLERFKEATARAEELAANQDWAAARAAFEEALEIRPQDPSTLARIRFCERRLDPAIEGFEIVGEEFDPASGLPTHVRAAPLGYEMRLAPAGSFDMGSDELPDAQPVHTVRLDAFYLGAREVTQAEWRAVMGANPSARQGDDLPVDSVSWEDAQQFIAQVNERVPGGGFRLPTEAEWEYAARASGGLFKDFELSRYAWYRENSQIEPAAADGFLRIENFGSQPVGGKEPNRWGFFDMHGNVWEWTSSLFRPYVYDASDGRESPTAEGQRVLRGGGFADAAFLLDPALRHPERPTRRYRWNGLRLARSIPSK